MPTKLRAKGFNAPKSATPKRQVKVAPEGVVTAIVAVTGVVDAVDDLIVPGAFQHTLKVRRPKVVDDHQWGNKAGRVLHVEEWAPGDPRLPKRTKDGRPWPREAGALVATMQYNLRSERGRESYEWVRFYAESNEAEFSIGYKVPDGKARKRGDGVRVILMVDLFEFSHVLFGAAPLSMALDVKSAGLRAPDTFERPALGDDEDTDTKYDDEARPDSWDDEDDEGRPRRASIERKTASSVLLEAKAGGADRNAGNAEHLRRWFLSPASGIAWGTDGDFRRCVAVASKHMTPEQAKGYCQLRHKEATGLYTGDRAHLEGKAATTTTKEVKAMSQMKGSYEERIALLVEAAEDLFRVTYNASDDNHLAVCPVATYAQEAVFRVYEGNSERSWLVPYAADAEGRVELGEPKEVELSLVAEHSDGSTEEADPTGFLETVVAAYDHAREMRTEGKAAAVVTEAKGAPAPVEADADTITADNLPDGEWQSFRKTQPIRAMRMDGPFSVQTREGVVKSDGGWLALDSDDQPYPIAEDEMEAVYEPDGDDEDVPTTGDEPEGYFPEDDYAEGVDDTEAPADDLEEDTETKGAGHDEDDEKVTVSPDEHFALMEDLNAAHAPDEDD